MNRGGHTSGGYTSGGHKCGGHTSGGYTSGGYTTAVAAAVTLILDCHEGPKEGCNYYHEEELAHALVTWSVHESESSWERN